MQVRPWLDPLVDLLKKMLRYEPSARIRARQALDHDFFKEPLAQGLTIREEDIPEDDKESGGEVIVLED